MLADLRYIFKTLVLIAVSVLFFGMTGCSSSNDVTHRVANEDDEEMVVIELDAPAPMEHVADTENLSDTKNVADTVFLNRSADTVTQEVVTARPQKKNIILMIADGAGFGAFYTAADYMTGSPKGMFYQKAPWKMASVATFHKKSFYDPEKDWANFKNFFVPFYNREPEYIPPDSASSATAIFTGVKTRNGRIGFGPDDEKLTTIAEIYHRNGYRTGAVTSFQIASATVAATAAHNVERKEGQAMFAEMLHGEVLDVLIGAGHPEFDDDGRPRPATYGKYGPSEETWAEIRAGKIGNGRNGAGWTFVESRDALQSYAKSTPDLQNAELPARLLGIMPVANSFQCHRSAKASVLATSPTLREATLAALNVLAYTPAQREDAFFLMVEGGAVDVANDAHDFERCIEEMCDFNEAVTAACQWVEKYSSWEETLVIVTADHDNGAIYGTETDADGIPTSAPEYRGKGNLATIRYYADDHTKQLVPIYVRGAGATELEALILGTDERMGKFWNYDGCYLDNTAIFTLMMSGKK